MISFTAGGPALRQERQKVMQAMPMGRAAAVQGKVRRTGRGLYALVPGAPGPDDDSPPADPAHTATEPAAQ